jgi:hypothetical protein
MRQGKTDWPKSFVVRAINREDLCTIGFPNRNGAALSGKETSQISPLTEVSYRSILFEACRIGNGE